MAWWNFISNWTWWDAVNQENLDRNAKIREYAAKMKTEFTRIRVAANFQERTEGGEPNTTSRITQRIEFVLTLPDYPGFKATIMTGAPRLDIPPDQWVTQLLAYATAGPRSLYGGFYFPAQNPAGHEEEE